MSTMTTWGRPAVGRELPNGAMIIDQAALASGGWIILAMWPKGADVEYITWHCDGLDGSCFWGRYFTKLDRAVEDFARRTAEDLDRGT